MNRQTSRQHWVSRLQPHHHGFFQRKYQKPHLEILGSLIFWVGLTLSKPAWSAPNVGSAALPVSDTDQKGTVGVTAASTDVDAIQSHPEVLPPGTIGEASKEWSQPLSGDDTRIGSQGDEGKEDTLTQEDSEVGNSPTNLSVSPHLSGLRPATCYAHATQTPSLKLRLSTPSPSPSPLIHSRNSELPNPQSPNSFSTSHNVSLPLDQTGRQDWGLGMRKSQELDSSLQDESTTSTNLHLLTQAPVVPKLYFQTPPSDSDPPHAPPLRRGENSVKVPHPPNPPLVRGDIRNEGDLGESPGLKTRPNPSCSVIGEQTLTPEQKPQSNPKPPSVLAEIENGSTPQPLPSASENSSELEQPASGEDPELGKLRLRELAAPPPPSKPAVYLLGGVGYFRSNNIFSGIDPRDDGLFRAGLTLLAAPSLGPKTSLFASAGGNIIRYGEQSQYDYDELNFNVGIRQQIGSRTYGELGWNNRQLFSHESGDRFLNDHSLYLELGRRDVLAKRLTLDTFYQLRLSLANPSDRSGVINYLGASLAYNPIPPLEVALDYQFALADFTQQERIDQYHQLVARLSYTLSSNSRAYLYGGRSFGHSTDRYTDFDGFVFGAGVNFNLTLF